MNLMNKEKKAKTEEDQEEKELMENTDTTPRRKNDDINYESTDADLWSEQVKEKQGDVHVDNVMVGNKITLNDCER